VRQKLKLPVWLIPLAWAAALVGGAGINLLLGGRVALPGVTGARLLTAAASTALMAATVATASGALSHIRPFQTAFASGAGAVTFAGLLLYPDLSASGDYLPLALVAVLAGMVGLVAGALLRLRLGWLEGH